MIISSSPESRREPLGTNVEVKLPRRSPVFHSPQRQMPLTLLVTRSLSV